MIVNLKKDLEHVWEAWVEKGVLVEPTELYRVKFWCGEQVLGADAELVMFWNSMRRFSVLVLE